MNKLSVFLSHSHKDVEKIRKIRDLLELLDCDPIMFYLKCLDENDTELENFIKREIDARNVFIYCKSQNAESSKWVQIELNYIKSINKNRIYTIDIENGLENNAVDILYRISNLIKKNTLLIFATDNDTPFAEKLKKQCQDRGYKVSIINSNDTLIPSMKQLNFWDYQKIKLSWENYFENNLIPTIIQLGKKGIFIPVCSNSTCDGDWNSMMFGKIIRWFDNHPEYEILKAYPNEDTSSFFQQLSEISCR